MTFKNWLASLRDSYESRLALEQASRDSDSRNFSTAWRIITEYDEDKPPQKVDATSGGKSITGVIAVPVVQIVPTE